jgi:SprT protein
MPAVMSDLKPDLEETVRIAVRRAEKRACAFYGLALPAATIDFSLRGRCAGQARIERDGQTCLRINRQLLVENRDDFLSSTIPHEVAHLVVNWPYRNRRLRPRPHGPEWQAVMRDCFGLEPARCHNYRTTPARVVPRSFLYICSCREHRLTSIMHKRIVRSQAFCTACRTPLRFVAKQVPREP